jgi:hypothetical protein
MFKVGAAVTNVRPIKEDVGNCLITTPSEGLIRFSPSAINVLMLKAGEYIAARPVEAENGDKFFAVYKANPNSEKYPEAGQKLGSPNGGGGTLQFSSARFYQELGGNDKGSKYFKIMGLEAGEEDFTWEDDGVTFYVLNFLRDEEKSERKASEKGKAVEGAEDEYTQDGEQESPKAKKGKKK